jgi:hypothetical protein
MPVIPATQETETGRIMVRGQSGKVLVRPQLKQQAQHGGDTYGPSYVGGLGKRIVVPEPIQD